MIMCHKNLHSHRNYWLIYTERTVFKILTTALWIAETWRCLTRPLVQHPTFSVLLGYLFKHPKNSLSAETHKHSTCSRSYFQLKIKKQNKCTLYFHDFLHLSLNWSLCSEISSYFKHKTHFRAMFNQPVLWDSLVVSYRRTISSTVVPTTNNCLIFETGCD